MHVHDQILLFVKANGPTLPTRIARIIKTDILIASAHLSDLSSQKKLMISNLKVGGSPLYYFLGQEDQLFRFAVDNLNPKDFTVLETLKEKKILREADLDLLSKVALRGLKDFAIPLQVRTKDRAELFWKWHSLSSDDTNAGIKRLISPIEENIPEELISKEKEIEKEILGETEEVSEGVRETIVEEAPEKQELAELDQEELLEKEHAEESAEDIPDESAEEIEEKPKKSSKKIATKQEAELTPQEKLEVFPKEEKQQKLEETSKVLSKLILPESSELTSKESTLGSSSNLERRKLLLEKLREKISQKNKSIEDDELFLQTETYFQEFKINVEQKEIIRKDKEINLLITVPSVVGKITFFCKVKSKNRCDEKDLSSAYMEAQMKRLPLLFLYTRDWTKRSREMLDCNAFDNVVVKKI